MARIRTIKPEFTQSESMGRISREARLCFILLWTIVDDSGRTRGASRMLASLLYPYDGDAAEKISGWLDELEGEKCLTRYTVDGNSYIQISKWAEHQKIDRPSPSKLPPLANAREESRGLDEASSLDLDLGPISLSAPEKEKVSKWAEHYRNRTGQKFTGVLLESSLLKLESSGLRSRLIEVIDFSISVSAKSWINPDDDYSKHPKRNGGRAPPRYGDHASQSSAPVKPFHEVAKELNARE